MFFTLIFLHFKNKILTHYYLDQKYPAKLSHCVDAPLNLFQKGSFDFKSQRFVAIVGTRDASDYGRKICKELIASFQNKNIVSLFTDKFLENRQCLI